MHRSLRSHRWFLLFANMSTRSGRNTHYDTLEIKHEATQNEIKSAYFKLTKQYHPDRNTSDEAKLKFQDISNAYEILGNYDKRKQYDRGLQIMTPITHDPRNPRGPIRVNYEKEATRVHEEFYRQSQTNAPNLDEWTNAYYERVMRRKRSDEARGKRLRLERSEYRRETEMQGHMLALLILMCVVTMISLLSVESRWRDVPKYRTVDSKSNTNNNATK